MTHDRPATSRNYVKRDSLSICEEGSSEFFLNYKHQ
jgi:hypothetical protein